MATMEQDKSGSLVVGAMLIMAAVFAALAGWYLLQAQQVFTNHALTSHSNESWNAVTISQAFDSGKCTPQQYACPNSNKIMRWCQLSRPEGDTRKPFAIGLVIGMVGQTEHIISGFATSIERWSNPGKMCR